MTWIQADEKGEPLDSNEPEKKDHGDFSSVGPDIYWKDVSLQSVKKEIIEFLETDKFEEEFNKFKKNGTIFRFHCFLRARNKGYLKLIEVFSSFG